MVKLRAMRCARNIVRIGEKNNAYRVFMEKKGDTPLERSRRRVEDNIKMEVGEL
jgi:hypothetical protein